MLAGGIYSLTAAGNNRGVCGVGAAQNVTETNVALYGGRTRQNQSPTNANRGKGMRGTNQVATSHRTARFWVGKMSGNAQEPSVREKRSSTAGVAGRQLHGVVGGRYVICQAQGGMVFQTQNQTT